MNRTLKFALGAVLGLGLVMPASAQNFPDIPDNHWAYEALANLKGKILYGYPDGLYRPARPMSRAEFAVAINQLYQMMMAKDNQLQSAIDALNTKIANLPTGGGGGVSQADFDALKRQVAEMQTRINSMQAWGTDIANLKRLSTEFERELAAMGVDMDAMKRDFADLASRVTALEQGGGHGIKISGDGNFVMLMGHSSDGDFGMTRTGRITGEGRNDLSGVPVGMTQDMNFFHEFNTTLSGNAGENVSWIASLTFGNMFDDDDDGFGDFTSMSAGDNIRDWTDPMLVIDQLNATFDSSLAGQGFTATVGRFRHSSGAFFMKRSDYTEFYANSRWDDGKYVMDGAKLNFDFGSVDVTAFGARNSDRYALGNHAGAINPMYRDLGSNDFETAATLGFELNAELGGNGYLRGVYLLHDSWDVDSGMNRITTYGGELGFNFSGFDVYGTYAQTDFGYNTNVMLNSDNAAYAVWLASDRGRWGFDGGYARVEGNFGAFGSWGRLGTVWNPSNIEGYAGNLWFKLNNRMKFNAGMAMFEGASNSSGLFGVFSSTSDSATSWDFGLDYAMNSAWNVKLGYETVDWDFGGSDPAQKWYTIGLDHNLSDAAKLSIMYMRSNINFDGNGLDPGSNNVYRGGILSSQLSFKY
jgi:hypothetical protein